MTLCTLVLLLAFSSSEAIRLNQATVTQKNRLNQATVALKNERVPPMCHCFPVERICAALGQMRLPKLAAPLPDIKEVPSIPAEWDWFCQAPQSKDDLLGTGGFGAVWKVQFKKYTRRMGEPLDKAWKGQLNETSVEHEDGSSVVFGAMKITTIADTAARELTVLESLAHTWNEHIPRFLSVPLVKKHPYPFVIEFANGGSLYDFMVQTNRQFGEARSSTACDSAQLSRLSRSLAFEIVFFLHALKGLNAMHQNKWVHQDLKPENIVLSRLVADDVGSAAHAMLVDFGIAARPFKKRTIRGTAQYMAPEIFDDENMGLPASDMWSMGVILYFMTFRNLPGWWLPEFDRSTSQSADVENADGIVNATEQAAGVVGSAENNVTDVPAAAIPTREEAIREWTLDKDVLFTGTWHLDPALEAPTKELLTNLLQKEHGNRISAHGAIEATKSVINVWIERLGAKRESETQTLVEMMSTMDPSEYPLEHRTRRPWPAHVPHFDAHLTACRSMRAWENLVLPPAAWIEEQTQKLQKKEKEKSQKSNPGITFKLPSDASLYITSEDLIPDSDFEYAARREWVNAAYGLELGDRTSDKSESLMQLKAKYHKAYYAGGCDSYEEIMVPILKAILTKCSFCGSRYDYEKSVGSKARTGPAAARARFETRTEFIDTPVPCELKVISNHEVRLDALFRKPS